MSHYRNIFFAHKKITRGSGSESVTYDGVIYEDVSKMQDFFKRYDGTRDLYIPCNVCAKKKYLEFIKVSGNSQSVSNKTLKQVQSKKSIKTVAKMNKSDESKEMSTSEKIKAASKRGCTKC